MMNLFQKSQYGRSSMYRMLLIIILIIQVISTREYDDHNIENNQNFE